MFRPYSAGSCSVTRLLYPTHETRNAAAPNEVRFGVAQSGHAVPRPTRGQPSTMSESEDSMVLWLVAAIIAIVGVVQLFQGQFLFALALFVIACLIGPGGYSVFHSRK